MTNEPCRQSECEFPYRPGWVALILSAGVCFAFGCFLGADAASNTRGMVINGLITLSPPQATIFLQVLAGLCFLMVGVAVFFAGSRVINPQKVVLANDGLYLPRWRWSIRPQFIPYTDIRTLGLGKRQGREFLHIIHLGGKRELVAAMFESLADYKRFVELLRRRVTAVQG